MIGKQFKKNRSPARRFVVRSLFFGAALYVAYFLSNEVASWIAGKGTLTYVPLYPRSAVLLSALPIAAFQLVALAVCGIYTTLLRYFRIQELLRQTAALFVISAGLFAASYMPSIADLLPALSRRLVCIDFVFAATAVCALRIALRLLWEHKKSETETPRSRRRDAVRVAIFGAGDAGSELCSVLLSRPNLGKIPVVFFDDEKAKEGFSLSDVPIVGRFENVEYWKSVYGFTELIIAIPAAKITRVRELREQAIAAGLTVSLVPGTEELSLGHASVSAIRNFDLQDLLDRPPLNLNDEAIVKMIRGKTVLVTGAGGSIGSEICRQVARCAPARLLLVEQCEVLMFQIEQDLISLGFKDCIVPIIADILDVQRVEGVFDKYHPAIVFHAAAHKHVPLMERQPGEALKNNSLGSIGLFEIVSKYRAEACVLISTDKAINPTNAMGASKRLAEIMLQSFARTPENRTRFMAVRFGNVLGSSGSVIPTFKKQIEKGGPLTVTSEEIKRYFMTIPEAVGLVLQTATIGKNGNIYVLDMGDPVKIIDVARHLIRLSGLRPDIDIEIKITGLRPGEKLFEELKSTGEDYEPSGHPRIARFKCEPLPPEKLGELKDFIAKIARNPVRNEIKKAIKTVVPEYTPFLD
ncbi:MAG: polysaccharide biosynthesis protein [Candidatus Spyradosoma sp.]